MKTYRGEHLIMYVEDVKAFLKVCESGVWFRHSDYPMDDNGTYFKIAQSSTRKQLPENVVCLKCASLFRKSESKKEFALAKEKSGSKIYSGKSLERLICNEVEFVWAKNMTEKLTMGGGERFVSYLNAIPNEVFLAPNMFRKMENALERGFETRKKCGENLAYLGFLKAGALNVLAEACRHKQKEERANKIAER